LNRPLVIAHRGFSSEYPENTLIAVRKAVDAGSDKIEVDVHQTKDEKIVVIHDPTIDRTTNGKGEVGEFDYATLEKFDAGSWKNPRFKNEYIPQLEEILEIVAGVSNIIIEVKFGSEKYKNFEKNLVNIVNRYKNFTDITISSFKITLLSKLYNYNPDFKLAKVVAKREMWRTFYDSNMNKFRNKFSFIKEIHPHQGIVNNGFLQWAKDREFEVCPYSVNEESKMKDFIKKGVKGIITDSPDKMIKLLNN